MNVIQERISHPAQAFRLLRLELPALRGGRHRHRQLELTWIQRGSGLRCVGDSVEAFDDDDLVLLGANLPHAWTSALPAEGAAAVAQPMRATVLQFAPELLDHPAWPELAPARDLAQAASLGLRLPPGPAHAAICRALQGLPEAAGLAGLAALLALLALLVQHRADLQPLASPAAALAAGAAAEQDRRIGRLLDWVQAHLHEPLTVADAAGRVHVTPAAFSRYFKRHIGKGYIQYINDLRCAEACLQLRQGEQPVALVAQACGFATLSHFNRQFRQRTGQTPRAYRQQGPVRQGAS